VLYDGAETLLAGTEFEYDGLASRPASPEWAS
jgi:hypothetical protein